MLIRGAGYGSTDCPPCYLLLLPCCSFPSLLIALRSEATHLCTERVIVYVVISYILYVSRPLSLFALYVSVATVFLSCYNSRPNLDSNGKEKEDCSAVL